jgi:hypothetical protein
LCNIAQIFTKNCKKKCGNLQKLQIAAVLRTKKFTDDEASDEKEIKTTYKRKKSRIDLQKKEDSEATKLKQPTKRKEFELNLQKKRKFELT